MSESIEKAIELHTNYLNLKIVELEKRLDMLDKLRGEALDIKTRELERRFTLLNELRAEVLADREQYLKRELYEVFMATHDTWKADVNKRITIIETRTVVWTATLGLALVVFNLIMQYFK